MTKMKIFEFYRLQVDIRDIATGESLFKLSLNQMVISVTQADYRGRGTNDLVICTRNGEGMLAKLKQIAVPKKILFLISRTFSEGLRTIQN